jgi:hypothetical protein
MSGSGEGICGCVSEDEGGKREREKGGREAKVEERIVYIKREERERERAGKGGQEVVVVVEGGLIKGWGGGTQPEWPAVPLFCVGRHGE